jgi:hypothetical protein
MREVTGMPHTRAATATLFLQYFAADGACAYRTR